jgi:nitroreductase
MSRPLNKQKILANALILQDNSPKQTGHSQNIASGRYTMIDILRARRSIRKYEKRAIDKESREILTEALLRCPSSRGINPWMFIFVEDPDLLGLLAQSKEHGSDFLKDAALGIVVCGDETKSDVWVEDCSIASIVVQLAAQSLGLGSCWIQIRKRHHSKDKTAEEYIQELLGIPQHLKVESIISIGYPAEGKKPIPQEKLEFEKIRYNKF